MVWGEGWYTVGCALKFLPQLSTVEKASYLSIFYFCEVNSAYCSRNKLKTTYKWFISTNDIISIESSN